MVALKLFSLVILRVPSARARLAECWLAPVDLATGSIQRVSS